MGRPQRLSLALVWIGATALVTGAGIHALAVAPHAEHWAAAGVFFGVLAVVQAGTAAVVVSHRWRAGAIAAVAVSAGTVALWAVTRTVGLPFGPGEGVPEHITRGDLVSTAASVVAIVALLPLVWLPRPESLLPAGAARALLAAGAPALIVTAVVVAAPSIRAHEHDHSRNSAVVPAAVAPRPAPGHVDAPGHHLHRDDAAAASTPASASPPAAAPAPTVHVHANGEGHAHDH